MFAERRHWSFSAIKQYLRCPLQYYFERILKLPQPTVSSGLVLGSAVHAALADYHLNLQRRTPTTIDKLQRVLLAYWTLREAERPIQYKAGENRVVQLATGVGLLETYLKEPPPEGVVGVEQRLLMELVIGTEKKPLELGTLEGARAEPIRYFVDCVRNNKQVEGVVSGDFNVNVMQIVEAARRSAASGKPVTLPLK